MKKRKGILAEFKEFALRGNVVDLAVGVLIGGAFQKIITSLINDLIMPWIGLLTGGINFADQFVVLRTPDGAGTPYRSLAQAQEAGATVFGYGAFITNVINFMIMAVAIFLLIKMMNKLRSIGEKVVGGEPEPAPAPTAKVCPQCCMDIPAAAKRCGHCTSMLEL